MLRLRLAGMMLLQFAVWGAWAPVLGKHLGNLKRAFQQPIRVETPFTKLL